MPPAPTTPTMSGIDRVTTFKIFVKNLSEGTTPEELQLIFEEYGRVVECEIFRNVFAFVHMEDEDCGKYAVSVLNGRNVRGNMITVEPSNQTGQGPKLQSTRLSVRNIPPGLKAAELRNLFKKYGHVLAAEVSNGTGIVNLEAMADLRTAIKEVNGFVYDGQTLIVEPLANTTDTYASKQFPSTTKLKTHPPLMQLPQAAETRLIPLMSKQFGLKQSTRPSPLLQNPHFRGPRSQGFNHNPQQNIGYSRSYPIPYDMKSTPETDHGLNYDGNLNEEHDDYESEYPLIQESPQLGRSLANASRPWQPPVPDGRVLRDPLKDGHLLSQGQHGMLRPQFPQMRHSLMAMPGQRNIRPLLSKPMEQSARPHFIPRLPTNPIRKVFPKTEIEPLFLRRHEILNPSQFKQTSTRNNETFYDDVSVSNLTSRPPPLLQNLEDDASLELQIQYQQQPMRLPAYRDNTNSFSNSSKPPPLFNEFYHDVPLTSQVQYQQQRGSVSKGNIGLSYNSSRPHAPPPSLLRQPSSMSSRRPPPLFQTNPVKRSVPHADPGQPFEVPGMIPKGVFQPPKKYFSNRPRTAAKKKKKTEPGPQPPIPEEPQRHVPDFNTPSNYIPKGSVLRAFPPPLMRQNFTEDPDFY